MHMYMCTNVCVYFVGVKSAGMHESTNTHCAHKYDDAPAAVMRDTENGCKHCEILQGRFINSTDTIRLQVISDNCLAIYRS